MITKPSRLVGLQMVAWLAIVSPVNYSGRQEGIMSLRALHDAWLTPKVKELRQGCRNRERLSEHAQHLNDSEKQEIIEYGRTLQRTLLESTDGPECDALVAHLGSEKFRPRLGMMLTDYIVFHVIAYRFGQNPKQSFEIAVELGSNSAHLLNEEQNTKIRGLSEEDGPGNPALDPDLQDILDGGFPPIQELATMAHAAATNLWLWGRVVIPSSETERESPVGYLCTGVGNRLVRPPLPEESGQHKTPPEPPLTKAQEHLASEEHRRVARFLDIMLELTVRGGIDEQRWHGECLREIHRYLDQSQVKQRDRVAYVFGKVFPEHAWSLAQQSKSATLMKTWLWANFEKIWQSSSADWSDYADEINRQLEKRSSKNRPLSGLPLGDGFRKLGSEALAILASILHPNLYPKSLEIHLLSNNIALDKIPQFNTRCYRLQKSISRLDEKIVERMKKQIDDILERLEGGAA